MNLEQNASTPKMDAADLWREEVFTDRKVGTIRRLIPVKADGSVDPSRKTVFAGDTQILTSAGALPLNFEIDADSLDKAVARYGEAVGRAFNEAMEEIKELRRRASSSIIIPEGGAAGLTGANLNLGNPPGGGKLKLR